MGEEEEGNFGKGFFGGEVEELGRKIFNQWIVKMLNEWIVIVWMKLWMMHNFFLSFR